MRLPTGFLDRPFAHRALHGPGRPENSREAVQAAVDAGFGIEIDVQASADCKAMVFHDYGLERLTGQQGTVQTKSARDLSKITLAGGDSGIPVLAEILEIVDGAVPLVIEVKDQDGGMGPNVGALEAMIARDVQAYPGPVAVMSFNPHSVAAMADHAPGVPRGIVTCAFDAGAWPPLPFSKRRELSLIPDYDRVGACFISHDHGDLSSPAVAERKAQGTTVLCWTIKSQEEAAQAQQIADQITFEGFLPA